MTSQPQVGTMMEKETRSKTTGRKHRYQVYQTVDGQTFTARIITGRTEEPFGPWGDPASDCPEAIKLAIRAWKETHPEEYETRSKPFYGYGSH